jgi:hypothetical protein
MSTPKKNREAQAKRLDQVAAELEKAAAHAKIAADHFRNAEIPRGCAHTFATEGHIIAANDLIKECALMHRTAARI